MVALLAHPSLLPPLPMSCLLADLRGLRSAPGLDGGQREALYSELIERMAACEWFTVGVMAPSEHLAVQALRAIERRLGWQPLEQAPAGRSSAGLEGPVFLKGNQSSGRFLVRREQGLGEGLLISGHSASAPHVEDTWGPLPLDMFG